MARALLWLPLFAACDPVLEGPVPTIASVSPAIVCTDAGQVEVTAEGTNFAPVVTSALTEPALALPDATLALAVPFAPDAGIGEVSDPPELWGGPTSVSFTVGPDLTLEPGLYDVVVANVDGAAATLPAGFAVLPPPSVDAISPGAVCAAGSATVDVDVTGSGFLVIDGVYPTLTLGADAYPATSADGCEPLQIGTAQLCTSLVVPVPTGAVGSFPVAVVTNPEPASCASSEPVSFEVRAPPSLGAATPDVACDPDTIVQLTGAGFAAGPSVSVEVDGQPYPDIVAYTDELLNVLAPAGGWSVGAHTVTVLDPAGCASETVMFEISEPPLVTSAALADVCDATSALTVNGAGFAGGLVVQVDGADAPTTVVSGALATADVSALSLAPGFHSVVVLTADGCASAPVTFEVAETPTIASVDPTSGCDGAGTLTVAGTGFVSGSTLAVGGVPAESTTVLSATSLEAELGATGLPTGSYDVTVTTPQGCVATSVAAYELLAAPVLYDVSPPVVYTGVELDVVLFAEGLTGPVTRVAVRAQLGGAETDLAFDDTDLEQIVATVPAGLAAGAYDVIVEEAGACPAVLVGGLTVQGVLTIDIGGVTPPTTFQEGRTWLTITATDPPGLGEVQFQDVPRVFLVPTSPEDILIELLQVTFVSPTELTVYLPAGYPPGVYDVLVVNPDGSAGLYAAAVEILLDPPPILNLVSPASIPASGSQTITVTGFNINDPAVSLWCRDPISHAEVVVDAPVLTWSLFDLTASVPTGSTGVGPCVVRVTNLDGQGADYVGLSVTDPSQRVLDWRAGPDLNVARRAPSVAAARVRPDARFVYAIGGDDGDPSGALDSIEVARLDLWGEPGPFTVLAQGLPGPRTLAGAARVGNFVYVVGGHDGVGPVDTVWRAQLLDPAYAPLFDAVAFDYGSGDALPGGTYIYRIAALFDPLDAYNAGGESLACDPIVVRVPDADPTTVVTLSWTQVFGAIGYRVYRTPVADSGSGTEEWLADVAGGGTVLYADHGDATDDTYAPLSVGALGEWTELPPLPAPLMSPAVVAAPDPFYTPVYHYVYAAGGFDGVALRDDVHRLDVYAWDNSQQDVGAWSAVSFDLPAAVHEAGAWVADPSLHTVVPFGETYVYFGGGRTSTSGTATTSSVVFGAVQVGGDLDALTATSALSPARAGFNTASTTGFAYGFGGAGAVPSADGSASAVLTGGSLGAWGTGAPAPLSSRYLAGSAQESAVFILVGGDDGSGATTATEVTNL